MVICVGRQGSTRSKFYFHTLTFYLVVPKEGGAEVDGDGGEPDHEEAEGDALRVVPHHLQGVQVAILDIRGQHRAGVQDGGQEVHLSDFILKQIRDREKLGADWL